MPRKVSPKMSSCSTPPWKCERGQSLSSSSHLQVDPTKQTPAAPTAPQQCKAPSSLYQLIPHLCKRCSETLGVQAEHPWGRVSNCRGFHSLRRSALVSLPKRACASLCTSRRCCSVSHWRKKPVLFFLNWEIAPGKSSNSKCARSSPYNSEIITRLHFCEQTTRSASVQGAWKKSMSQETWTWSFDVLHSEGLGELSSFPHSPDSSATMAYPALWAEGEAGESIRCFLGGGSPVTCKTMNSFVLPKAQNQLRGEKEIQLQIFSLLK